LKKNNFKNQIISEPFACEEYDERCENNKEIEKLNQPGSIIACNCKYCIHCLTIIGQIEGHSILPKENKTTKYEQVIPQLVAIEQEPEIDGLLMLLNTEGGDVEAGLALAELIAGMKKPTVSLIIGGGHSIAIPLAVAAKKSFIAKSASATVHPVRTNGTTIGVPQTLDHFKKVQERITNFVTENSNITPARFKELAMNTEGLVADVGTILNGTEAVQEGLIDSLGTLSKALETLYQMIEENNINNNTRCNVEKENFCKKNKNKKNKR